MSYPRAFEVRDVSLDTEHVAAQTANNGHPVREGALSPTGSASASVSASASATQPGDESLRAVATPVLSVEQEGAASSSGVDDGYECDGSDQFSSTDAIFAKWKDEANGVLLWLARMPVDNVFPRPPPSPEVSDRKSGETLTVNIEEKLPEVFRKLVLEGFLSAPVVDSQGKYTGFIDMLDLVVFTLKIFSAARPEKAIVKAEHKENGDGSTVTATTIAETVWDEQTALAQFSRSTVRDAMRTHENELNPQHAIPRGFSLFHAVEVMARTRAHRVAITDKQGKVSGILTQSMVISLLDQAMESRFPTIASVPVSVLMADAGSVECISETDSVINAFGKMVQKNFTGLPVVNANGHLCDNISVRDLRGIGTDATKWRRLFVSVKEYKDLVRTEYSRQTPHKPIFVQPSSTLAHVLKNTFDGNIYRVYVANAGRNSNGEVVPLDLLHVITQRDVLRFVLFLTLRLTAAKRLISWWRHGDTLPYIDTQRSSKGEEDDHAAGVEHDDDEAKKEAEHIIELAQVRSTQHAIQAIEGGTQIHTTPDELTD